MDQWDTRSRVVLQVLFQDGQRRFWHWLRTRRGRRWQRDPAAVGRKGDCSCRACRLMEVWYLVGVCVYRRRSDFLRFDQVFLPAYTWDLPILTTPSIHPPTHIWPNCRHGTYISMRNIFCSKRWFSLSCLPPSSPVYQCTDAFTMSSPAFPTEKAILYV